MIMQIKAEGIGPGLKFETELGRLTLLVGPNGAGKSSRVNALMLARWGFIPGESKKNGEILAAHSSGDEFRVEIKAGNQMFGRRWKRSKDAVSQDMQVDWKRKRETEYLTAINDVKIFDLAAFLQLSAQGKTDLIFSLFPPKGDRRKLDKDLEEAKTTRNTDQARLRVLESTAERLAKSRAESELPAGNIAEIASEIEALVKQQAEAQRQLEEARKERSRVEWQTRVDAERKKDAEKLEKWQAENKAPESADASPVPTPVQMTISAGSFPAATPPQAATPCVDAKAILEHVMAAMARTGCDACTARMMIRSALKKMEAVNG